MYAVSCKDSFTFVPCSHFYLTTVLLNVTIIYNLHTVFLSAAYCIEYRSTIGKHHLPPGVIPDGIHSKTTTNGRVKRSQQ